MNENRVKEVEKITQVLKEKARQHAEALSIWARQEFNLAPEYYVKVTATLSVKKIPIPKLRHNPQELVFTQQPTSQDWENVIKEVKNLSTTGKSYHRSKRIWRYMVQELQNLQKLANRGYVSNATRLNVHLKNHNLPYRLIRVDKPGEDTLYSLLVATSATRTP